MVNAQVVLSPANGKRLIAKAVLESMQFRKAIEKGIVVLSLGTTNALIYEQLTGNKVPIEEYAAGVMKDYLGVTSQSQRRNPLVLEKGKISHLPWLEALEKMDENSLFIKGANAFDESGLAGILVGGEAGGTIGKALGTLAVKKVPIIVPVGIGKRVPSVLESARILSKPGVKTKDLKVGMIVVTNGSIINEISAFKILFNIDAVLVAAGGILGYEGSGLFSISGAETAIKEAVALVDSFK